MHTLKKWFATLKENTSSMHIKTLVKKILPVLSNYPFQGVVVKGSRDYNEYGFY